MSGVTLWLGTYSRKWRTTRASTAADLAMPPHRHSRRGFGEIGACRQWERNPRQLPGSRFRLERPDDRCGSDSKGAGAQDLFQEEAHQRRGRAHACRGVGRSGEGVASHRERPWRRSDRSPTGTDRLVTASKWDFPGHFGWLNVPSNRGARFRHASAPCQDPPQIHGSARFSESDPHHHPWRIGGVGCVEISDSPQEGCGGSAGGLALPFPRPCLGKIRSVAKRGRASPPAAPRQGVLPSAHETGVLHPSGVRPASRGWFPGRGVSHGAD